MNSIRVRMVVLFIVMTSAVLAAFGLYARVQLSDRLEARFSQLTHATLSRLVINTREALWNFDSSTVIGIMQAEMQQPEVDAIQVFGSKQRLFSSLARDAQGNVIESHSVAPLSGFRMEADVVRSPDGALPGPAPDSKIGAVAVVFSRKHIDEALRAEAWRSVTEILVIDIFLVVALALSLGMVFRPLQRLRDALFDLARQDGDEVQELAQTERTEFREVVQGFNQTLEKLKRVMARHADAEEKAQTAAKNTEQAYVELQAAQQSLLQTEKLASLGGLVAGVAHEINTPVGVTLTGASGLLEATESLRTSLTAGTLRKSEITAYVEMATSSAELILRNAERAAQLIQSFKQVAVDQTSEQRREYELKKYVDEVMSSLHPALRKGQVQVSVECPATILLDGYPGAMAQVLTNLTMNALAHAFKGDAGAKIAITVTRTGDRIQMRFCDNGSGILPEHLGKIFDPFFTTRRGQGGTGLGLNIVHNIMAKQFGGSVRVESTVGQGTSFILEFPAVSPKVVQESVRTKN